MPPDQANHWKNKKRWTEGDTSSNSCTFLLIVVSPTRKYTIEAKHNENEGNDIGVVAEDCVEEDPIAGHRAARGVSDGDAYLASI